MYASHIQNSCYVNFYEATDEYGFVEQTPSDKVCMANSAKEAGKKLGCQWAQVYSPSMLVSRNLFSGANDTDVMLIEMEMVRRGLPRNGNPTRFTVIAVWGWGGDGPAVSIIAEKSSVNGAKNALETHIMTHPDAKYYIYVNSLNRIWCGDIPADLDRYDLSSKATNERPLSIIQSAEGVANTDVVLRWDSKKKYIEFRAASKYVVFPGNAVPLESFYTLSEHELYSRYGRTKFFVVNTPGPDNGAESYDAEKIAFGRLPACFPNRCIAAIHIVKFVPAESCVGFYTARGSYYHFHYDRHDEAEKNKEAELELNSRLLGFDADDVVATPTETPGPYATIPVLLYFEWNGKPSYEYGYMDAGVLCFTRDSLIRAGAKNVRVYYTRSEKTMFRDKSSLATGYDKLERRAFTVTEIAQMVSFLCNDTRYGLPMLSYLKSKAGPSSHSALFGPSPTENVYLATRMLEGSTGMYIPAMTWNGTKLISDENGDYYSREIMAECKAGRKLWFAMSLSERTYYLAIVKYVLRNMDNDIAPTYDYLGVMLDEGEKVPVEMLANFTAIMSKAVEAYYSEAIGVKNPGSDNET